MFSDMISVGAGEGLYRVEATAIFVGDDVSVCVGGGSQPHIGAVSLGIYEPIRDSATVSTITVHTHRDDAVASHFAKAISRGMKCTVTVSAGLHVDDAAYEDIKCLWNNAVECCALLLRKLKGSEEE